MSYCTLQDLLDDFGDTELIQLTDLDGLGVIDQTRIARAIARADRTINRYLGARASLPMAADEVVDLACDIARYFLYDDQPTTTVSERYDHAIAQLKAMAKGELGLADSTGAAPTIGGPEYEASTRVFDDDTLSDY